MEIRTLWKFEFPQHQKLAELKNLIVIVSGNLNFHNLKFTKKVD